MLKRIAIAALFVLPTAVLAQNTGKEKYLDYPQKVDTFHNLKWPVCKGPLEKMRNCVVDGDTLRADYHSHRVGQLDTPETRTPNKMCPDEERAKGLEAKAITLELVNEGKEVKIITYIHPLLQEPARDKYGRRLAKIEIDGKDLGEILIERGLARRYAGDTKGLWCD